MKNFEGCQLKKRNIKRPADNVKNNGDIDKYKLAPIKETKIDPANNPSIPSVKLIKLIIETPKKQINNRRNKFKPEKGDIEIIKETTKI